VEKRNDRKVGHSYKLGKDQLGQIRWKRSSAQQGGEAPGGDWRKESERIEKRPEEKGVPLGEPENPPVHPGSLFYFESSGKGKEVRIAVGMRFRERGEKKWRQRSLGGNS